MMHQNAVFPVPATACTKNACAGAKKIIGECFMIWFDLIYS